MERIICLAIGYLFGLFQTAYIYGRMHGIDIRQYGSGNAGTTNTLRVLGTKAGLIVFAGDVLKCIFAIVTCSLLFGKSHPDMVYLFKMYAAAGAILGHNFPFPCLSSGACAAVTASWLCRLNSPRVAFRHCVGIGVRNGIGAGVRLGRKGFRRGEA